MKKNTVKYLPILIIFLGMASIYFSGVYHYLSLDYLRMYHKSLKAFVEQHAIAVPIAFCLIYVISTALSVPGAVFLTLLGGYLFPQPFSTIYVVFSATFGATLIFLAAQTALKEMLRKKARPFLQKALFTFSGRVSVRREVPDDAAGDKGIAPAIAEEPDASDGCLAADRKLTEKVNKALQNMEKGFQENAVSYLLFLRFVPLFPFWLVNIAPAFFGVSLITFVWTTLVGIFPGTLVFTLAGGGLEKILENNETFSISTIFNTQIKIALILLGVIALLPILWKKLKKNKF